MAFEKLQFTKSWENARDFPTYEPSEAQVRADLQLLHEEARNGLNKLVDALNDPTAAAQLPFQGQGLTADNIQAAILEVYAALQNTAAGQIVNGSVTKEKLAAALLARIYGGRPWVSMNTPGTGQTPDTDFPIGQLWLRPSFTVENLAGSAWIAAGGTVEAADNGWKLTGDGSVTTAVMSQILPDLGTAGEKAFVSLRASELDSQMTGLTLTLNGTGHDLSAGGGVFETALDSQGGLALTVTAQWPAAALAVGSVDLTHFAVVNADATAAQLTDCEALYDWPALLTALVPFTEVTLPREIYIQVTPGGWYQTGFETLPVSRGGTGLGTVGTENSVLQIQGGKPVWCAPEQVTGLPRIATGSYTGNDANRTITLPVAPKLLVIGQGSGQVDDALDGTIKDNPIVLCSGAVASERYAGTATSGGSIYYLNTVALSGDALTFSRTASSSIASPKTQYGNRSGIAYSWVAVY